MPTQTSLIPFPSYQHNDVAIVLDSSGSIGYNFFENVKLLVDQLAYAIISHDDNRLIFITYSDYPTTRIDITNTLNQEEISYTILNTHWEGSNTATYAGIDLAVEELTYSPRSQTNLNMIVFTSGDSAWPQLTIDAANMAIRKGIRTYAVGFGPFIHEPELLAIAGNDKKNLFKEENFHKLKEQFI